VHFGSLIVDVNSVMTDPKCTVRGKSKS